MSQSALSLSPWKTLLITGAITITAISTYAIYFDHQRRHNASFRKSIQKKTKLHDKQNEIREKEEAQKKLDSIANFLKEELKKDPLPTDPKLREAAFSSNVELGEQLSAQPGKALEAAAKFYKALTVYPNPADLLGIYQRSIPEGIYDYVVLMLAVMPPSNVSSFLNSATGGPSKADEEAIAAAIDIED